MSILNKILNQKITIDVALIMLTIVASVPAFRNAIYEGDIYVTGQAIKDFDNKTIKIR